MSGDRTLSIDVGGMTIAEQLRMEVRQWASIGQPALMQRFILATGQPFRSQPLPKRYRRRQMKACFFNAITMVKRSSGKLRYVEGYARGKLGLLIHHAWSVDSNDRVIDATWLDSEHCDYFGRVFTVDEWERETDATDCMCVLDSGMGMNWRFMFAEVPGLKEQVLNAQKKAPELLRSAGAIEGTRDHEARPQTTGEA